MEKIYLNRTLQAFENILKSPLQLQFYPLAKRFNASIRTPPWLGMGAIAQLLLIGILSLYNCRSNSHSTANELFPKPLFSLNLTQGLQQEDHRIVRRLKALKSVGTPGTAPVFEGLGTHYSFIWVGTPAQRVSVIMDTGSHHTAFPCVGCKCGKHMDPHFDPKKSSTSLIRTCNTGGVSNGIAGSALNTVGGGTKKCFFKQAYTEGSSWNAFKVKDKVWIGGPGEHDITDAAAKTIDFEFGCQESETGLFRTQKVDGIMGLSAAADTLPYQLVAQGITTTKMFALCFRQGGGIVTLGGVDTSLHDTEGGGVLLSSSRSASNPSLMKVAGSNSMTRMYASISSSLSSLSSSSSSSSSSSEVLHSNFSAGISRSDGNHSSSYNSSFSNSRTGRPGLLFAKMIKPKGWYTVKLLDVLMRRNNDDYNNYNIGDNSNSNAVSIGAIAARYNGGKGTIVDSGTTDTYLPSAVKGSFAALFKKFTGRDYSNTQIALSKEQFASMPVVIFRLQAAVTSRNGGSSTIDLEVFPSSYMESNRNGRYTPRIYLAEASGAVLGANSMNGHNVIFDPDNLRVGFARSACMYNNPKVTKHSFDQPNSSPPLPSVGSSSSSSSNSAGKQKPNDKNNIQNSNNNAINKSDNKNNSKNSNKNNNNINNKAAVAAADRSDNKTNNSSNDSEDSAGNDKKPFLPQKMKQKQQMIAQQQQQQQQSGENINIRNSNLLVKNTSLSPSESNEVISTTLSNKNSNNNKDVVVLSYQQQTHLSELIRRTLHRSMYALAAAATTTTGGDVSKNHNNNNSPCQAVLTMPCSAKCNTAVAAGSSSGNRSSSSSSLNATNALNLMEYLHISKEGIVSVATAYVVRGRQYWKTSECESIRSTDDEASHRQLDTTSSTTTSTTTSAREEMKSEQFQQQQQLSLHSVERGRRQQQQHHYHTVVGAASHKISSDTCSIHCTTTTTSPSPFRETTTTAIATADATGHQKQATIDSNVVSGGGDLPVRINVLHGIDETWSECSSSSISNSLEQQALVSSNNNRTVLPLLQRKRIIVVPSPSSSFSSQLLQQQQQSLIHNQMLSVHNGSSIISNISSSNRRNNSSSIITNAVLPPYHQPDFIINRKTIDNINSSGGSSSKCFYLLNKIPPVNSSNAVAASDKMWRKDCAFIEVQYMSCRPLTITTTTADCKTEKSTITSNNTNKTTTIPSIAATIVTTPAIHSQNTTPSAAQTVVDASSDNDSIVIEVIVRLKGLTHPYALADFQLEDLMHAFASIFQIPENDVNVHVAVPAVYPYNLLSSTVLRVTLYSTFIARSHSSGSSSNNNMKKKKKKQQQLLLLPEEIESYVASLFEENYSINSNNKNSYQSYNISSITTTTTTTAVDSNNSMNNDNNAARIQQEAMLLYSLQEYLSNMMKHHLFPTILTSSLKKGSSSISSQSDGYQWLVPASLSFDTVTVSTAAAYKIAASIVSTETNNNNCIDSLSQLPTSLLMDTNSPLLLDDNSADAVATPTIITNMFAWISSSIAWWWYLLLVLLLGYLVVVMGVSWWRSRRRDDSYTATTLNKNSIFTSNSMFHRDTGGGGTTTIHIRSSEYDNNNSSQRGNNSNSSNHDSNTAAVSVKYSSSTNIMNHEEVRTVERISKSSKMNNSRKQHRRSLSATV